MPIIQDLIIYPVKSCKGISVKEISILSSGLQFDRKWQFIDDTGNFLSQRQIKELSQVSTSINDKYLKIKFEPTQEEISVEIDTSNLISTITTVWGDKCQAFKYPENVSKFFSNIFKPFYNSSAVHLVQFDDKTKRITAKPSTSTPFFADGFPFLIVSQESLDDLNSKLNSKNSPSLPMDRFRPNIVTTHGKAYDEDLHSQLKIGDNISIKLESHCTRCVITTIDQLTTNKSVEPLLTLSSYKNNPSGKGVVFGHNGSLLNGQNHIIRVGMEANYV